MESSNYLKFNYSANLIFPPIPRKSFPFPPNLIPEPIYSIKFFIENIEQMYFLRHTQLQHFCIPIEIKIVNISQEEVIIYVVYFHDIARTVGYQFKDRRELFLNFHHSEKKLNELSDELRYIYSIGNNQRPSFLDTHESDVRRYENIKYLEDNSLKPSGKWEESLFRDAFDSNPHILSDSEFEMIFGRSR